MPQHKPSSAPPQPFQRVLRVAAALAATLLVTWSVLPAGPRSGQALAAEHDLRGGRRCFGQDLESC